MKPVKKISVSNLQPGMITAQDFVINKSNLLNKDYLMNDSVIKKLKLNYSSYDIYIHCNENDIVYYNEQKKFEDLQKSLNDISSGIEQLFSATKQGQLVSIDQVRSLSSKLINFLNCRSNIIKFINLPRDSKKYLYSHSINVALLSILIAQWMNLDEKSTNLISNAALLHDIGKITIPENIIGKPGFLRKDEFDLCKTHSLRGYEIVKNTPYINPAVLQAILFHHERLDGTGYPMHLKDDKIPTFPRIIAVSDTFDAVTSNRCYKEKSNPLDGLAIIKDSSFYKLDPVISHTFILNISKHYEGQSVILNNNKIGELIKLNLDNLLCPIISLDNEVIDLSKNHSISIKDFI